MNIAANSTCAGGIPFPSVLSPVAFSIGGFDVRWYALAYIFGFIFGWLYVRSLLLQKKHLWRGNRPALLSVELENLITWVILGVLLGGRLGYVLIYDFGYYRMHPKEIVAVWHGGMSFHGGCLGAIIAIFIFARFHRLKFLEITDLVAMAAPIGLFLGRLANFANNELVGRPIRTGGHVPWAVCFPGYGNVPRHPSQLYEAILEGVVLFILMRMLARMGCLKRPGSLSGFFLLLYGLARITAEFFREPDARLGFIYDKLTMGMILSIPMVILGSIMIAIYLFRRPTLANKAFFRSDA